MASKVITWTPAGGPNSTGQQVQFRLPGGGWTSFGAVLSTVATTLTVTGLSDNTIYEFRVENICSVGGPTPSTGASGIGFTCANNTLTSSATTIAATWTHIASDINNYHVILYTNADVVIVDYNMGSVVNGTMSHTFTGLSGSTTYKVRLVPYAGSFVKSDCPLGSITTSSAECNAPTGVVVSDVLV